MMSSNKKGKAPPTVANYVLQSIREAIMEGKYASGDKLDQRTLADEFGVSLIPVREALRQLEAEGLVKSYPHRGAFVAELSIDELKEIYLIRASLEGLATQLAVLNLSSRGLDRLGELIDEMEQATIDEDFDRLLDLNREFHFSIYEAAEKPLLLQLVSSLWDRSTLYRRLYTYLAERATQALEEHKAIYAACTAGDAEAASNAVRVNVNQTVEGIVAKLGDDAVIARL